MTKSQEVNNPIGFLERNETMAQWEYKNLQFKTLPGFGAWSRVSGNDLERLERLQKEQWEVFQVVNIRGSFGFSAHILFMLRRELK